LDFSYLIAHPMSSMRKLMQFINLLY
jgi:hypothetical protein